MVNTQLDTAASKTVTDNRLISAAFFTTLVVTLWTTGLIAYRIHSSSNLIQNRQKPRFYNILEIIIQSSFLYLLVLGAKRTDRSNSTDAVKYCDCFHGFRLLGYIARWGNGTLKYTVLHLLGFSQILGHGAYSHGGSDCDCINL